MELSHLSYAKGLGVHTVSEIVYALGGEFTEFISDIGVDAAEERGAMRFKVCVVRGDDVVKAGIGQNDSKMMTALYGFRTSGMTGKEDGKPIWVKADGAQVLRLCVGEGLNGLDKDYAGWCNARLIKAAGSVVYLSDMPDERKLGLPWDRGTVRLKDAPGKSADPGVTALWYEMDKGLVLARFNYLADLGYPPVKHRPVLNSYMKEEQ